MIVIGYWGNEKYVTNRIKNNGNMDFTKCVAGKTNTIQEV